MEKLTFSRYRLSAIATLSTAYTLISPKFAFAHVKWFCAFDVASQPRFLKDVLTSDFGELGAVSVALLLLGAALERTGLGEALLRALDRTTTLLRESSEIVIRALLGAFFVALWTKGGIILTPELTTNVEGISWLQLAIAAGLIWRSTMILSALGMLALYAIGIASDGLFHMLDYPIFVGLAIYIGSAGLGRRLFGLRPLDIMRWAAAITMMWASVEKWAYPQWTFPLFTNNPAMTMGLDREFFMVAAGMVEFALAFGLACTPLVRRVAATILCGMFVSAITGFGKIDAIGHTPIIAVMLAIMADDARVALRSPVWYPAYFTGAVFGFLAAYYGLHAAWFGTLIGLST
ncbi:MAG: hypothetical protein JOY71_00560 [Acetobacteraceae bacterium]|nr:hypothetical protein [Acetobacteraceae bacterium]MBV8520625.1 hypothetical protein [Acetobacteraceae bacterium]